MKEAKFIVLEGLEGSGKSTALKTITATLRAAGIEKIKSTREPGGSVIGEKIRLLIKKEHRNEDLQNMAELLLLYAARIQLTNDIIKPALKEGVWMVSDRYDMSSQAYQGGGRGISPNLISTLKTQVLGEFKPDLTFYLDVDPKVGLKRVCNRGQQLDRIEKMGIDFFDRTRKRYLELSNSDSNTIVIDAEKEIDLVNCDIRRALILWLNKQ
ncbi:thymidylate kinase [Candidatus Photodesmus blepharus]|uniref:Thymidylate kinase n=1 Tax=Candidatus Photodesmus blepharonis TaxID=1179155 RepID=A0A084CN28_9GAMM|nr:dTMP kinase [Candidatus Photodesmus blepharus]KEY91207.1 thymidylate kinase [Candidatus Photodesmus blepharus]